MTELQSILLHLDGSPRCAERTRMARAIGEAFAASVTGAYSVVPSVLRHPMGLDGPAGVLGLADYDEECRREAGRRFTDIRADAKRMRWEDVPGDSIGAFERRALYADLVVVGQRDSDVALATQTPADFIPRLIVHSGRPCLIVPCAGSFPAVGRTVAIAWKPTREAARAISAAMPFLRRAQEVHAIGYGEEATADLLQLQSYLRDHLVAPRLHPDLGRDVDVGEDLLSRLAELGVDLLVMGCYGHSRAREWVFGGVSRAVLRSMTMPVLMAH